MNDLFLYRQHGFSLIELMVSLAVLAIVASLAVYSYQGSVQKARRSEARALVLEAGSRQEQVFSSQSPNSYGQSMIALGYGNNNQPTPNGHYLVSITEVPAGCAADGIGGNVACTAYTIVAQPQNAQTDDDCGNFTINQLGARGVNGSLPVADCW